MQHKPLGFEVPKSTSASLLSTKQWPAWALGDTRFQRIAYAPQSRASLRGLGTTAKLIGHFVTERIDTTDFPLIFNYNSYAHVETSLGPRQGPSRPATFISHLSSVASSWFDALDVDE